MREDDDAGVRNELGGTVYGPSVQAGAIHGGVHIRAAGVVLEEQVPWQLPPTVPLTDRLDALEALERHHLRVARQGHATLAAVSGLGGVGKTTVALAWLHTLRARYPGGQLYADMGAQSAGGPVDPAEVLGRFLRDLGVPGQRVPVGIGERIALYRSLTTDRRLVVLLDDAATAAQVRPLLPGGGNVTVVTSRWRLPGLTVDGCCPVQLEPLAREEAVELLETTLADGRVTAQRDDARALVDLCAGLPLAVRVAGARLAARPHRRIDTMVHALSKEHGRLDALAITGDHSVGAALDLSYQGLPPKAARLYRLLGLHPGREFSRHVAVAALGGDDPDIVRLLDLLHDANLLTEAVDADRHRFHDLVRLHAVGKATEDEPPEGRTAALRRIADHYVISATRAEEIIDPQHRTLHREYGPGPHIRADFGAGKEDPNTALDWLEGELPNLMAVLRWARPAGIPAVSWQLADAMWPLFLRRKHYEQAHTAHAVGLAAARETGDVPAECRMLTSGGVLELGIGDAERALGNFTLAAELFRHADDTLGHARTLNYRGLAHQQLGQLDRAAPLFAEAATRLPACDDRRAGALARFNLAEVALSTGRFAAAIADSGFAHDTLLDEGDAYNAARAAALMGRARLARGAESEHDLDEAEAWLSRALTVLRSMSADYEAARALESLARLCEHRGLRGSARDRYREALALYSAVDHVREAETVRTRLEHLEQLDEQDGTES